MDKSDRPRRLRGQRPKPANGNVGRAVSRLEEAVNDLVASAGESAAGHIERAAERVRRQTTTGRSGYRPRPRREPAWLWSEEPRSAKLYRDTDRGKLLGVCAGIARYCGLEVWVVRCIAITGVIFLNWVVVVAYLIAGFVVLETSPVGAGRDRAGSENTRRGRRRGRVGQDDDVDAPGEEPHRLAAPSPRQQLRVVDADFDAFELRLRRMETHVTSGRYELHREFGRIGDGAKPVN